jgi:hypothetical protein
MSPAKEESNGLFLKNTGPGTDYKRFAELTTDNSINSAF